MVGEFEGGPVCQVAREVLDAVTEMIGPVAFDPRPQETPWSIPLGEDDEHATYDPDQVSAYLAAAPPAALVLGQLRAPYRGRATPVNAWWGSFDLAVSLFSGRPADRGSSEFMRRNGMDAQEVAVDWWPGDPRYPKAVFYGYAHPAPSGSQGLLVRDWGHRSPPTHRDTWLMWRRGPSS